MFSFNVEPVDLDGLQLQIVGQDPISPDSIRDDLLRWHFRQSVLANMRGEGETVFKPNSPLENR